MNNLLQQGFKVVSSHSRFYDVVCISKYSADGKHCSYHLPPDGFMHLKYRDEGKREEAMRAVRIEVRSATLARDDITIGMSVVHYKGHDYPVENIRNGLSGAALVIGVYKTDDEEFGVWHLYTDTPSANPDRPDQCVTNDDLRAEAKEAMNWSPQER